MPATQRGKNKLAASDAQRKPSEDGKSGGTDDGSQQIVSERYRLLKIVGEGTYGVVHQAVDMETGRKVAMKKIRLDESGMLEHMGIPSTAIREIVLLRELQHPNVVGLLDVVHPDNHLWLAFEFCDSDLRQFLKAHMKAAREPGPPVPDSLTQYRDDSCRMLGLPNNQTRNLTYQLLLFWLGCGGRGSRYKVCWWLVVALTMVISRIGFDLHWYRAPELLLGETVYGVSVDLWSIGCILAEMHSGRPLFPGDSEIDTLYRIFRLLGTPTTKEWPEIQKLPHHQELFPKWLVDVPSKLRKMLPGLDEPAYDLLQRLLKFEPTSRITAVEALSHPWFQGL